MLTEADPKARRIQGRRTACPKPNIISTRAASICSQLYALMRWGIALDAAVRWSGGRVTDRGSGRAVKVVLTSEPKLKSLSMRDRQDRAGTRREADQVRGHQPVCDWPAKRVQGQPDGLVVNARVCVY